ncbi:MAG TPA: hypothetical protein VKQ36_15065, partial [Ktedonobacterales bacterium]|nr:hypothetical protein [Ktedonobacterales bacterium]
MDDRRDKRKPGSPGPAREQRATQSKKADEASANTPDQSLRGRSLSDYKPGGPLSADQPEPTTGDARRHGGLLSRFAGWRRHAKPDGATSQSAPPADRTGRPDQEDAGQEQRAPRAGDWRASDFEQHELEVWDRYNAAPFELPEAPDDTYERIILDARKQRQRSRSGFSHGAGNANQDEDQDEDDQDEDRDVDDVDDADAAWEEGWDDTWATQDDSWLNEASPDKKSKSEKGRRATDEEENDSDDPPQRGQSARERGGRSRPRDQGSSRPDTFFRLTRTETTTAFGAEIGWLRRLLRRRPASAA